VDQTITRRISILDVRNVFANGEVIEDYPDDKYGPQLFGVRHDGASEAPAYSVQLSSADTG
jgi:hypothetical protein